MNYSGAGRKSPSRKPVCISRLKNLLTNCFEVTRALESKQVKRKVEANRSESRIALEVEAKYSRNRVESDV